MIIKKDCGAALSFMIILPHVLQIRGRRNVFKRGYVRGGGDWKREIC